MGCGQSLQCDSAAQNNKTVVEIQPPNLKKKRNPAVILFQPEPRDASDVILCDCEGFEYHLHANFLKYVSLVFRDMEFKETPHIIYCEYSTIVTFTFCQMIYNQGSYEKLLNQITIHQLLDLWKCCYEYKLCACAFACVTVIFRVLPNIKSLETLITICNAIYHFQNEQMKETIIAKIANCMFDDNKKLKLLHDDAKIDLIMFLSKKKFTDMLPPHTCMR